MAEASRSGKPRFVLHLQFHHRQQRLYGFGVGVHRMIDRQLLQPRLLGGQSLHCLFVGLVGGVPNLEADGLLIAIERPTSTAPSPCALELSCL